MTGEDFRGDVHFVVGVFAGAFTLYNLMRYAETHERRNLLNVVAYSLLLGLERRNTKHHWSQAH